MHLPKPRAALLGFVLAVMGPVVGFFVSVLVQPGILIAALLGRQAIYLVFVMGGVPSVATALFLTFGGSLERPARLLPTMLVGMSSTILWLLWLINNGPKPRYAALSEVAIILGQLVVVGTVTAGLLWFGKRRMLQKFFKGVRFDHPTSKLARDHHGSGIGSTDN